MGRIIECSALPGRENWFIAAEEPDFLIVAKGRGIPSAPLEGGSVSVFEKVSAVFPEILAVNGKKAGEGGLIHRIDTETCGLLLIARNDSFFQRIAECRKNGTFVKEYTAYSVADGGRQLSAKVIESRFRSYGKKGAMVKPVFDDADSSTADRKKAGSRVYVTHVVESAAVGTKNSDCGNGGKRLVRIVCRINEGFRHQVRSHLAYSDFPVLGDPIYGNVMTTASEHENQQDSVFGKFPDEMLFYASGLSFVDDGESVSVRIPANLMDKAAVHAFESLARH